MPSTLPSPLPTESDQTTDSTADADMATSVAEYVLIDVTSNPELEPTKANCAQPKLAPPSFVFTQEHMSTWQNNTLSVLASPRLARATFDHRYAIAAKRSAIKPWAKAARLKKQRPVNSRWTFTLDSGIALEGVPLTRTDSDLLGGVPLTRSGVSNLFDGLDL